jgi:glyoxylase-like metal-dependent hydrolase (beta-lactamase superfamily II)
MDYRASGNSTPPPPIGNACAVTLIDTEHMGVDRVIGCWVHGDVLVDPRTGSTVPTLLEKLGDLEPRAILLTHIHLDHAGGTGTLLRSFPEARVYVHESGAPHMADPSRLLSSAGRLYGDRMEELWGEVAPVPERSLVPLRGGETVAGLEVMHTPGHASHHVTYLDGSDGTAYVGDVAGVRIAPAELTVMPTPPPEIDVEAWQDSLRRLAAREPARLRLTHFGEVEPAAAQLALCSDRLGEMAEWARAGDRDGFGRRLAALIDDQEADAAERMRVAMPPDQVWAGLDRYWRKREG